MSRTTCRSCKSLPAVCLFCLYPFCLLWMGIPPACCKWLWRGVPKAARYHPPCLHTCSGWSGDLGKGTRPSWAASKVWWSGPRWPSQNCFASFRCISGGNSPSEGRSLHGCWHQYGRSHGPLPTYCDCCSKRERWIVRTPQLPAYRQSSPFGSTDPIPDCEGQRIWMADSASAATGGLWPDLNPVQGPTGHTIWSWAKSFAVPLWWLWCVLHSPACPRLPQGRVDQARAQRHSRSWCKVSGPRMGRSYCWAGARPCWWSQLPTCTSGWLVSTWRLGG